MSFKEIFLIIFMMFNSLFSLLLYNFYSYDILFSISIVLNLSLSLFILVKKSPEDYTVKLSIVYLGGFALFICGRNIANLFGASDIYCFDFGYTYCLTDIEKLRANFLINFSLIFFILGFCYRSRKNSLPDHRYSESVNKRMLILIILISFFTGFISLYFQYQTIIKALSQGYMVLYEGQGEIYQTPVALLCNLVFAATLAVVHSVKNSVKPIAYYFLIAIYIIAQMSSILTGARGSFISSVIVLLWIALGNGKIGLKKTLFIFFGFIVLLSANFLASLTEARIATNKGSLYEKIVHEVLYDQGISMMVFNIGSLESDYPTLAYLKTIFPGIQFFYSFFNEIYQYQLSFSQFITYKLAPSVYFNNMGWGWTLLGDFYAFSFGFFIVFLFYNFIWGKLIFTISNLSYSSIYFRGLFFCFMLVAFTISRASVSYLIFFIVLYSIFHLSLKLVIKVKS